MQVVVQVVRSHLEVRYGWIPAENLERYSKSIMAASSMGSKILAKLQNAGRAVKSQVDRLGPDREFETLIRGIGECKSKQEEDRIMVAEIETLKQVRSSRMLAGAWCRRSGCPTEQSIRPSHGTAYIEESTGIVMGWVDSKKVPLSILPPLQRLRDPNLDKTRGREYMVRIEMDIKGIMHSAY